MKYRYTVKGHWPFPADMLRHDNSRAATDHDQQAIDRLSAEHAPDRGVFVDVEINLVGPYKPNTARWASFGWSVPSDKEYALDQEFKRRDVERRRVFDEAMAKLTPQECEIVRARITGDRGII